MATDKGKQVATTPDGNDGDEQEEKEEETERDHSTHEPSLGINDVNHDDASELSPQRTDSSDHHPDKKAKKKKKKHHKKKDKKPAAEAHPPPAAAVLSDALEPGAVATHRGGLASSHHNSNSSSNNNTTPTVTPTQRTKRAVTALSAQQSMPPAPVMGQRPSSSVALEPPPVMTTTMTTRSPLPTSSKRTVGSSSIPSASPKRTSSHNASPMASKRTMGSSSSSSRDGGGPNNNASVASSAPSSPATRSTLQSKQVWQDRRQGGGGGGTDLIAAVAAPPLSLADAPSTTMPSERSLPAVGAFAVSSPAPEYAMEDEEDGEWEQLPLDVLHPSRQSTLNTTTTTQPLVLDAEVQVVSETELEDDSDDNDKPWWGKRLYWIGAVACLVVVVVVIVVAVAVGGRDGSDDPSSRGTLAPSPEPTPGLWDSCFTRLKRIQTLMLGRRDYSEFIDVKLCRTTTYEVVEVNRGQGLGSIDPPLTLQSNMRLKCDEDGDLFDECIVGGGRGGGETLLLHEYTVNTGFPTIESADNVTIEGITFEEGAESLVELTNAGDIIFKNCLFRLTKDFTPIVLNFEARPNYPELNVTFEGCIFENLSYGPSRAYQLGDPGPHNYPGYTSIIFAINPAQTVVFRDCTFRNNKVVNTGNPGNVITSLGAKIQIENTCFYSHSAGLNGSPIAYIGDGEPPVTIVGSDNYVEGNWECALVSQKASLNAAGSCQSASTSAPKCLASADEIRAIW